jgi:DNA-directed RNA polymerase specialized sigma24 family protein
VLEQRRAEEETREEEEEDLREGVAFLDWALPRLASGRRRVIELDREELSMAEIQERLGMSADAIYAARSRALKDLSRLRGEWTA